METPPSSIGRHGTEDLKGRADIEGACKYNNPQFGTVNSSYGGSVEQEVDSVDHEDIMVRLHGGETTLKSS